MMQANPTSLREIRAVIFDLDGVIVDSEKAHLATFNQVLRQLGAKIDSCTWKRNYTGIGSVRIMEDVFLRNAIDQDVKAWVGKRADVYQKHVEKYGLPAIPGFKRFYQKLGQNKKKSIVASGGHRSHIAASLRAIGLPNLSFVGLEDVPRAKPHPGLFLLAARRLGVQPCQCVVFEDSLAGLEAAKRAGMRRIALSTTLPRRLLNGKADMIVKDFNSKNLRKLFSGL